MNIIKEIDRRLNFMWKSLGWKKYNILMLICAIISFVISMYFMLFLNYFSDYPSYLYKIFSYLYFVIIFNIFLFKFVYNYAKLKYG